MLGPGRSGAAGTHARLARPPRPGPTRALPALRAARSRAPGPAGRIYRCARPALALRSAPCNNTVSRVGNETWEENKAAGGVRSGGRRPCRRRWKRRRKAEPGAWQGGGSPDRSPRSQLFLGRAEARCWRRARHSGTLGRRIAGVHSPVSYSPWVTAPEELRGDHLEPLHRDLVTESGVIHGPGHAGPC